MISAATAMHAVENNYRTVLIEDACRGVNEHEIEVKRVELNENGCIFVDSDVVRTFDCFVFPLFYFYLYQVPGMVAGEDRRPEVARSMFIENLKSLGRYPSH
jgi:hypothetical protein